MPVIWELFTSPVIWDTFELDCILGKENQLFTSIGKFRYLGMEDLPQEFWLENSSINGEFLENKTGEITARGILDIYIRNCKWCSGNWG